MSEASHVNRRRFLKYVGAGAVAIGGVAAGYYQYETGYGGPQTTGPTTAATSTTQVSTRENHPPVANFMRRPYYLNPTDQQTTQFTSNCYDADNDPLQYAWSIDGEQKSTEKDYSTRLSAGEHLVQLAVSDGRAQDIVQQTMTVDPDQIYPTTPLHVKHKGVCYLTGMPQWNNEFPSEDQVNEHLEVIHNELGCNSIRINGYYDDDVLRCARLAIEKGFECIQLNPRYLDCNHQDTVERLGAFAVRAEELRQRTDTIQLQVANELCLDSLGIWNGETWGERATSGWVGVPEATWRNKLQNLLLDLAKVSREKFRGLISYVSGFWEADAVPWEIFDVIGVNAYVNNKDNWTEDVIASKLNSLKRYSKPVYVTEFGCGTYAGAAEYGGAGFSHSGPYDEDEQANYYGRYLGLINRVRVHGCSPWVFSEVYTHDEDRSALLFSIINNATRSRKKSFYAYKSYRREFP